MNYEKIKKKLKNILFEIRSSIYLLLFLYIGFFVTLKYLQTSYTNDISTNNKEIMQIEKELINIKTKENNEKAKKLSETKKELKQIKSEKIVILERNKENS